MNRDDDMDITEDPELAGRLATSLTALADDVTAPDDLWSTIEREGSARGGRQHRGKIVLAAMLATAAVLAAVVVVRLADAPAPDSGITMATEPDGQEEGSGLLTDTPADSWARLLGKLPAAAINQQTPLFIQDVSRARTQAGVEALPSTPTEDEWRAHAQQLFDRDALLTGELQMPTPAELHTELGFGPEQIDQIVTWGMGEHSGFVATGRFDPATIAATVAAEPIWGPELDTREEDGLTVHRWGSDARPTNKRTPVRELGVGGQLIVGDGWIAWTRTDADVDAIIDASVDPAGSLAGVGAVRSAADSADRAGLTEAAIVLGGPEERADSLPRPKPGLPTIDPPATSSGGSGQPSDGHLVQFRLDYATEAEADANLEAFTNTWASITEPVPQVDRDGAGLLATFTAPGPFELTGEYADGIESPLALGFFLSFFNVRAEPLDRPDLPDPRPTQAEILADGTVTNDEYRLAFWTFVECATAAGASFATISEAPDGGYDYTTSGTQGDACYTELFMQVDMTWQTSR